MLASLRKPLWLPKSTSRILTGTENLIDDGAGTDPEQGSETKSAAENEQTEFREPTEVSNDPNSRLVEAPATFSPESIATDDSVKEDHSIEAAKIEIDNEKNKSREDIERETEDPFAENGKTTLGPTIDRYHAGIKSKR